MFVGTTLGRVLTGSVSVYVCACVLSLLLMLANKSVCVSMGVRVSLYTRECVHVEAHFVYQLQEQH